MVDVTVLNPLVQFNLGSPMRQCRAVPFRGDGMRGLILAHCDFPNIDAHARYVRYPTDTLKISAFTFGGERLWAVGYNWKNLGGL